jgi:CHC2 zinc finger
LGKYALTELISDILGVPIRESRKDALVRCPFHDDRHASLSIDLEQGWWICFACGARGGIQSLATRMNREVNDADLALRVYEGSVGALVQEPKNFASLARELRRNLSTSRPDDVVRFITERKLSPSVLKHFGLGWNGRSIAFPYYDEDGVFGVKYRSADGSKYAEPGSRRGIYNVNDVRFKPFVILCEGESDTLAVWSELTTTYIPDIVSQFGVGGIPGVAGSRSTWEVWALDLLWAKKVFVAFDADEAGDNGAILPMQAIGEKAVRIRPTLGKDMTDHFLQGGMLSDFDELADEFSLTS